MATSAVKSTTRRRFKRATIIKISGVIVIALFVVSPSLLHFYAGIGVNPILTGSMRPAIQPGDVLITQTTPITDIKVGDVVALVSQDTGVFFAHRVVQIQDQSGQLQITTKGDANAEADPVVYLTSTKDLVPKSIGSIPLIGYPLVYLNSVPGRQASIAFIVTANIIALFLFLFKEKIKQVGSRAYQIYRDLYAEAQLAKVEKEKAAEVFRELFDESQATKLQKEREAQVFRELFDESQATKSEKEREAQVFRELFNEERVALIEREQKSEVYKDLFMQSQEQKEINEAEMAQLMQEMKQQQYSKEKS